MRLDDLDDTPGGVPEYMSGGRNGGRDGARGGASTASRRALGAGPSRIADEVARAHRDDDFHDDGMSDVSPDVQALLRSQLAATGRSAESAPALSGKDAPASKGGRGGRGGSKSATKGAAKKPAAKKPAAKVALVKRAARPKAKGSKKA